MSATEKQPWVKGLFAAMAFLPLLVILALHARYYTFICDDAFISFRYVRNLVDGHGLVFNPGERVEGYTNFLWVLELATLWKLFGVRPETACLWLSSACSLATVGVAGWLAWTGPFRAWRWLVVWSTVALLALNRSFAVWTTSGLETRQFTLLVMLGAVLLCQHRTQRHAPMVASFVLGLAALTRPEGLLFGSCALGWYLLDVARDRRPSRHDLRALLPFIGIAVTHACFRVLYYRALVPNTFVAKHVRPWPEAGLSFALQATIEHALYLVVPLAILGLLARLRKGDWSHLLGAALIVPHALFTIYRGGDHFEFRALDIYWLPLTVASVEGLLSLALIIGPRLSPLPIARPASFAGLLSITLIYSSAFPISHQLAIHEKELPREVLKQPFPLDEDSAPLIYLVPFLDRLVEPFNATIRYTAPRGIAVRHQVHLVMARQKLDGYAGYELAHSTGMIPEGLVMAVGMAGIIPYYLPDVTILDRNGLTDAYVARLPVSRLNSERHLAHDRAAPQSYLDQRGLNAHIQPIQEDIFTAMREGTVAVRLTGKRWMPIRISQLTNIEQSFGDTPLYRLQAQLRPGKAGNSTLQVGDRTWRGQKVLGAFDDLEQGTGWSISGKAAFLDQPRAGRGIRPRAPSGMIGQGMVVSEDESRGDQPTGTLTSPRFKVRAGQLLCFSIGRARHGAGVRLLAEGQIVATWHGNGRSTLKPFVVDLSEWADQSLRIQLFDESQQESLLVDHMVIYSPS